MAKQEPTIEDMPLEKLKEKRKFASILKWVYIVVNIAFVAIISFKWTSGNWATQDSINLVFLASCIALFFSVQRRLRLIDDELNRRGNPQ